MALVEDGDVPYALLSVMERSDRELLTALGVANANEVPPLRSLATASPARLTTMGISHDVAERLAIAFELGRRACATPLKLGASLRNPSDVADVTRDLAVLPRERVVALYVDKRHGCIARRTICDGWADGAPVDPREVFRAGLEEQAAGVILVHKPSVWE